ncbi:phosphatase PAP2 family protein [Pedobacter sandarakinus]|uniref:phosphatase PAP2 family protein n=1 Tax=Pedobacter sandarakinus TaxID=353156 RepID=UPI002247213A|nr:phosphatase PAP2 family protein [Pedobacter sandarakinus]MCX2575430.1 phosphatase PAP2 family protein [Pedobacter sandarakinus]
MIEGIQQFDVNLFFKIHRGLSNGFFDWLMPLLRNRFFWSPLYLFIVVFCIRHYKKQGLYIIATILFTFAVGDTVASKLIKPFVARVRPCNDFSLSSQIIHRVPCGSGLSFPSSHATNHFAIAVFLICIFYPKWKPILPLGIFWAFIISFAQVYVGVHYPLDVTAGALLGTVIGILCSQFFKKLQPDF